MADTVEQIQDRVTKTIQGLNPALDLVMGPIPDVFITPQAIETNRLQSEIDSLRKLFSVEYYSEMTEDELDAFAYNDGIERSNGTKAKGSVNFKLSSIPQNAVEIPEGTSVSTSDSKYQYVTTETVIVAISKIQDYYNPSTREYVFSVNVEALDYGDEYDTAPYTVIRLPSPPASGMTVENPGRISGGSAAQSNAQLADDLNERSLVSDRTMVSGLRAEIIDRSNGYLTDIQLHTNASSEYYYTYRPSVVAYVLGTNLMPATDSFVVTATKKGTVFPLSKSAVSAITSVKVEGIQSPLASDSYELRLEDIRSGSSLDSIAIGSLLLEGKTVTVSYTYDKLLVDLTSYYKENDVTDLFGIDFLFRKATPVPLRTSILVDSTSSSAESDVLSAAYEYLDAAGTFATYKSLSEMKAYIRDKVTGLRTLEILSFGKVEEPTNDTDTVTFEQGEYPYASTTAITVIQK